MLSYATENQKGKFIAIFWGIFNLGAVVGASVSLGQNFHSTVRSAAPEKVSIYSTVIFISTAGKCWYVPVLNALKRLK